MKLRRLLLTAIFAPTLCVLASCRTLTDSPNTLASNAQVDGAAAPAAEPVPAVEQPAAMPQSRVQKIGQPPAKPIVGQPLPSVPRDDASVAACAPPVPYGVPGPFVPPGIKGPWPMDEYLHDGGDADEPVTVSPEWAIAGLNIEDTVAHYDTQDGRTKVEATNCAYVYAPRFSSVRTVLAITANEHVTGPTNVQKPVRPVRYDERQIVRTNVEQQQPIGHAANLRPTTYLRELRDGSASTVVPPSNYQQSFVHFENLSVIRNGSMQGAEKARLAEATDAAIVWTKDEGVTIFVEKTRAVEVSGDRRAQAIYTIKEPVNGRLRICKIASTPAAKPGEFVEFTLRYDNVGDQVLGNIVILDSLTSRLEYVADSAQSSRPAHFVSNPNAAESLELRWEIDEPLYPGDGGIVRFKCKVR